MIITIENLQFPELVASLCKQANDAFPDLKNELRLNMLAKKWHKNAEFCICRDDNNHLIGMIAFYANQKGGVAYIPHVYVDINFRCRGIFASMLLKIEKYIGAKGFKSIQLEVKNDNLKAQKAYQKLGFRYLLEEKKRKKSRHMQLFL